MSNLELIVQMVIVVLQLDMVYNGETHLISMKSVFKWQLKDIKSQIRIVFIQFAKYLCYKIYNFLHVS